MIQQVLIGLGLIFGIVGCLSNPFYGLITLMGINMIQPGELYPVFSVLHVERVVALLTIIMVLVRGPKFVFPRLTRWCLIFFGATVASIPFSFWISNSITCTTDFAKTIILSVLLATLANTRKRLKVVLVTFSILVAYLAITSLVAYAQGNFQVRMDVDRAVGLTSASDNPDTLGLTIATALPFMFLFIMKDNRARLRWLMAALIAAVMVALLLTGSRGSLMTFVAMLGVAVLLSRRRLLILPLTLALGFAVWTALPAQYKARYETVNNLQNDDSYQNRLLSWEGGWQMFLHNPLTGIGMGNYAYANGMKYWPAPGKVWLDAHSLYFKILGELGIIGVVAFGGFVVVFFKTNNELTALMAPRPELPAWMRHYPRACNLALIGLLYCGYAYHDVYRTTWYFLAAVSASFLLLLTREAQEAQDAEEAEAAAPLALDPAGRASPALAAASWSTPA